MTVTAVKKLLCVGRSYRGVTIVDVNADDQTYAIVVGSPHPANGQAVQVYPCGDRSEAEALVDAALLLNLPVRELGGGARAVSDGCGSIVTA
jgi:hypothetical protein